MLRNVSQYYFRCNTHAYGGNSPAAVVTHVVVKVKMAAQAIDLPLRYATAGGNRADSSLIRLGKLSTAGQTLSPHFPAQCLKHETASVPVSAGCGWLFGPS